VYALSAMLRGKGATVLVADTGREAFELARPASRFWQLVLMDIMMPEMDGYEAMRTLRRDPRFQGAARDRAHGQGHEGGTRALSRGRRE